MLELDTGGATASVTGHYKPNGEVFGKLLEIVKQSYYGIVLELDTGGATASITGHYKPNGEELVCKLLTIVKQSYDILC